MSFTSSNDGVCTTVSGMYLAVKKLRRRRPTMSGPGESVHWQTARCLLAAPEDTPSGAETPHYGVAAQSIMGRRLGPCIASDLIRPDLEVRTELTPGNPHLLLV
ncbi:UNVERIFIED_ORG: hypothetical protein BDU10_9245 [Burkholderia sp. CF145]|jgi:hypothetical protein